MDNQTPFSAEQFLLIDEDGNNILTYVLKATWHMRENDISLADDQKSVILVDEYYGETENSSIRYESEIAFSKPGTDIILIGSAYGIHGMIPQVDVMLKVGNIKKKLRVSGKRYWDKAFGVWYISDPEPFDKFPIRYEHAFGGLVINEDHQLIDFYDQNPVGTGYEASTNKAKRKYSLLPNIEDPGCLISGPSDQPFPAGFGFIAPNWKTRKKYSGTFDDHWKKNRFPLLPHDFNRKFFNSAHPDLVSPQYLKGGELVELLNLTPTGKCQFSLPDITPEVTIKIKNNQDQSNMNMDTLIINTDENLLFMIWRKSFSINNKINQIKGAKINFLQK